jgi:formate hydrogenlyase subunit 6/NADH:ubiquinone oxidoreductase subunit I
LVKSPHSCVGCGACRRVCPMGIEEVHSEMVKRDVQTAACLNCGNCVGACASDRTLSLRWFGLKLVASSRRLALGLRRGKV